MALGCAGAYMAAPILRLKCATFKLQLTQSGPIKSQKRLDALVAHVYVIPSGPMPPEQD
jgi:hypothetical protein